MSTNWADSEQLAFLRSEMANFLKARQQTQKVEALRTFWKKIYSVWFQRWPEEYGQVPTDVGVFPVSPGKKSGKPKTPREKKEDQIYRWFYNQPKDGIRAQQAPAKKLMHRFLKGRKPRPLQPTQLYHKLKKEAMRPLVEQRIKDEGATSQSDRMKIRRQVLHEAWVNEPAEVIKAVEVACHSHNDGLIHTEDQPPNDTTSRTPQEYDCALSGLPAFLHNVISSLAEQTGWVISLSAGGPLPAAKGRIYLQHYYFGPRDPAGNDFKQSYKGFVDGFERPFSRHVKACFPPEVCSARSLESPTITRINVPGVSTSIFPPAAPPRPSNFALGPHNNAGEDSPITSVTTVDHSGYPVSQANDLQAVHSEPIDEGSSFGQAGMEEEEEWVPLLERGHNDNDNDQGSNKDDQDSRFIISQPVTPQHQAHPHNYRTSESLSPLPPSPPSIPGDTGFPALSSQTNTSDLDYVLPGAAITSPRHLYPENVLVLPPPPARRTKPNLFSIAVARKNRSKGGHSGARLSTYPPHFPRNDSGLPSPRKRRSGVISAGHADLNQYGRGKRERVEKMNANGEPAYSISKRRKL